MATEYKLSYTAAEIDEKLGMIDNCATEEFVDNNLIVKPIPPNAIKTRSITALEGKNFATFVAVIDIEELENTVPYGCPTLTDEERAILADRELKAQLMYCVYCEDDTRKILMLSTERSIVISKAKNSQTNVVSLTPIMPPMNIEYRVDITDKSTAKNVVVTKINNRDFLGINNTREFIPTNDYQPVTKKYVDDAIAALRAELTATTE